MPGDIPPTGGAEKTQQIMLKMENHDKKVRTELIVAFTETLNLHNDSISPEELWNWVEKASQQCPYDSSEGLYTHNNQLLEICEIENIQPTDEEKLKRIQERHHSLVTGHPGQAKIYDL
jgi:hypothetical protein